MKQRQAKPVLSRDKEESSDDSSNGDESEGGEDEDSEDESPDNVSSDLDGDEKVGSEKVESEKDLSEDEDEEEEEEDKEDDDDEESSGEEAKKDEKDEEKAKTDDKGAEEGDKQKAAPATETSHALVPVTAGTAESTAVLRNSTTNKREWDAFCRQLKSGNKIPCQVSEYAQTAANKTCLFGMWLDAKKDWTECSLILERTMKQQNEAEKGWCAVQGKDLKKKFEGNPDKYQKLIESRKKSGLWYPDDDFPDDDEEPKLIYGKYTLVIPLSHHSWKNVQESLQRYKWQNRYDCIEKVFLIPTTLYTSSTPQPLLAHACTKEAWFFMRVGNSFKRKDITSESMKLKGTMDVDPSLRAALTDADEGIFRPGALPKMQTSSTNGNKMLLDAVDKARACGCEGLQLQLF